MAIDFSTNIGKVRVRVGDISDLPYLPDAVYSATLADNDNNLPRTAKTIAIYILGQLAYKTHKKMGLSLEVWGQEAFDSYKQFLLLTVSNPAFMESVPTPYGSTNSDFSPIAQFQGDWNRAYYNGTQSQELANIAVVSPNDGSLYGSSGTAAWTLNE